MTKLFGSVLLFVGMAGALMAAVPEIDPGSSVSALVLLSGALIVIRASVRK